MIRRPPRSTPLYSSAASDVYKRQLVASTHVLIPIEPDGLSLIGLADILRMIENVKKTTNPDLNVLGIIPSRFRMVRRQARDVIGDMERMYGHLLLPYIKDLAEISAATTAGYDVFSFCSEKSQAYRCISNLVDAVLASSGRSNSAHGHTLRIHHGEPRKKPF